MIAAFFLVASFLKELITPEWQKNVRSITQEAVLALEEEKIPHEKKKIKLPKDYYYYFLQRKGLILM